MRTWLYILGGLLAWTAHFFGVYGAASIFPGDPAARWLTLAVTAASLLAAALLLRHAVIALRRSGDDGLHAWLHGIAGLSAAIGGLAIFYQGLPALF